MKYYVKHAYKIKNGETIPKLYNKDGYTVTNCISKESVDLIRQDIVNQHFGGKVTKQNKKAVEEWLNVFIELNLNPLSSGLPDDVEELQVLGKAIARKLMDQTHADN